MIKKKDIKQFLDYTKNLSHDGFFITDYAQSRVIALSDNKEKETFCISFLQIEGDTNLEILKNIGYIVDGKRLNKVNNGSKWSLEIEEDKFEMSSTITNSKKEKSQISYSKKETEKELVCKKFIIQNKYNRIKSMLKGLEIYSECDITDYINSLPQKFMVSIAYKVKLPSLKITNQMIPFRGYNTVIKISEPILDSENDDIKKRFSLIVIDTPIGKLYRYYPFISTI